MSPLPPEEDATDAFDEQYRRASAAADSRPREAVRRSILAHAERLAAERAQGSRNLVPAAAAPQSRVRWRAGLIGGLAAAALAAFLVVPRLPLGPHVPAQPTPALTADADTHPAAPSSVAPAVAPIAEPAPPADAVAVPQPQATAKSANAVQALMQSRDAARSGAHAASAPPVSSAAARASGAALAQADRGVAAPAAERVPDPGIAFRRAAARGDVAALAALRPQQADLNGRDTAGRTALMLAVQQGETDAVAALLDYGADPNIADFSGATPLAVARASQRASLIRLLEGHGAR